MKCQCGNAVSLENTKTRNGIVIEVYECPRGHSGTVRFNDGDERRTGALNH